MVQKKNFGFILKTIKLALVQLNGNRIKIKWLSKYAKRLITVCFQTVYGLIFLKNPIELNQCHKTVRLCKVGRPGTGENWDEKVTGELAKLLTIPCASYDFAVWMDKECVISPSFVPPYYRLIHGNELLSSFVVKDYPKNQKYKVTKYKLSAVEELLVSLNKHKRLMLPIGFTANDSIESAMDIFISYLLFDCFISNPDRHHENWGILLDNKSQKYHLAPTYDHASGLGCRVSDEEREKRLSTKDKRYTVGSFVNRPRTPFYDNGSNRLKIIDAFTSLAKKNKIAANYWLNKLETVPDEAILNYISCLIFKTTMILMD